MSETQTATAAPIKNTRTLVGRVVSDKMESVYKPLVWKCAFGHTFKATPNTVLRGGHWCPECMPSFRSRRTTIGAWTRI